MKDEAKKVESTVENTEAIGLGHDELAKETGKAIAMPDTFRGDPEKDAGKTRSDVASIIKTIDEKRFSVVEMKNQIIIKNKKEKDTDKIQTWCWISKNGSWTGFVQTPAKVGEYDLSDFHISEVHAVKKRLGRIRMYIPGVKRLEIVGAVVGELFGVKKSAKAGKK